MTDVRQRIFRMISSYTSQVLPDNSYVTGLFKRFFLDSSDAASRESYVQAIKDRRVKYREKYSEQVPHDLS